MAPHLLTLPLEVRYIIYTHLHKEIRVESWTWELTDDYFEMENLADICLHNAPVTSFLRVCSQLYHEYVQADCFKAPSASVRTQFRSCAGTELLYDKHGSHVRMLLSRVQHLSVMVKFNTGDSSMSTAWAHFRELATILCSNAPNLISLEAVFHVPQRVWMPHANFRPPEILRMNSKKSRDSLLPAPPLKLGGMPLKLHGQGYQIALESCHPSLSKDFYCLQRYCFNGYGKIRGLSDEVCHHIARIASFTYGCHDHSKCPPTQQGVIEAWPMPEYPKEMVDALSEKWGKEGSKQAVNWQQQVLEWKEQTGDEMMKR